MSSRPLRFVLSVSLSLSLTFTFLYSISLLKRKCNFPMNPHVRLLVCWSVGRVVTLPCSYCTCSFHAPIFFHHLWKSILISKINISFFLFCVKNPLNHFVWQSLTASSPFESLIFNFMQSADPVRTDCWIFYASWGLFPSFLLPRVFKVTSRLNERKFLLAG